MGEVRKLWIEGPAGRLEAALRVAENARALAVVAHPHPLHGGTLHNPVVFHTDRELNRAGFTTLRFNFRGVGTSEGTHDDGRGEVADLAAAASWLRGVAPAVPILLVGYSFGSRCALDYAAGHGRIRGLVAIGFPVLTYPMESLERYDGPLVLVHGSADELAAPSDVRERLERAGKQVDLRVIRGASHLFPGQAPEAGRAAARAAVELVDRFR